MWSQDLFAAGHEPLKPSEGIDPLEAPVVEVDHGFRWHIPGVLNRRVFGAWLVTRKIPKLLTSEKRASCFWVCLWIPSPFKTCFGKHQSTGMESLPMWAVSKILGCFVEKARLQIRSSLGCHHFGWFLVHPKNQTSTNQAFPGFFTALRRSEVKPTRFRMKTHCMMDHQFLRLQQFSEAKNGSFNLKMKVSENDPNRSRWVAYNPFFRILHPDCTAPFSNLWQVWFVAWVQTPAQFLF